MIRNNKIWQKTKLGNIGKIVSGGTPSTDKLKYWNGDIFWITPTEITKLQGKYILNTERKITKLGLEKSSAKLIPAMSLIICSRATVGDCGINKIEITTNQGFKNIIPNKKIDILFLYYFICTKKLQLKRISSGSTFLEFSKFDLEKLNLLLPPLPEQNRIVAVLEVWDGAIEKLGRKIEIKKQIKKGLMQNLLTGKKRLRGFNGKWESVKLGDVIDFKNGKAHERNIVKNGKYIVVNSKFISSDAKVLKYSDKNLMPLFKNDIVMVMSDVPNGKAMAKCFLIDKNDRYTLNQRICLIKVKKDNSKFLFYILNRNRYFLQFNDGVKQTNLRKDDILDCSMKLPNIKEQTAIAQILTTADLEIESLEKKKGIIEEQKKFLLNNLVTGRIRV